GNFMGGRVLSIFASFGAPPASALDCSLPNEVGSRVADRGANGGPPRLSGGGGAALGVLTARSAAALRVALREACLPAFAASEETPASALVRSANATRQNP